MGGLWAMVAAFDVAERGDGLLGRVPGIGGAARREAAELPMLQGAGGGVLKITGRNVIAYGAIKTRKGFEGQLVD